MAHWTKAQLEEYGLTEEIVLEILQCAQELNHKLDQHNLVATVMQDSSFVLSHQNKHLFDRDGEMDHTAVIRAISTPLIIADNGG